MPPDVWVLIPLAGMATGGLFMVGIYKLVNRWLELRGRRELPPGIEEELLDLRGQVAELTDMRHRMTELEERVDFAERLLTRGQADAQPGGR